MFETDAHATRHGLRTRGLGFADPHNDPREHQLPMEIFPPEKDSDFRAHIERPTVRPDEDAIGADIGAFRLDEESPPRPAKHYAKPDIQAFGRAPCRARIKRLSAHRSLIRRAPGIQGGTELITGAFSTNQLWKQAKLNQPVVPQWELWLKNQSGASGQETEFRETKLNFGQRCSEELTGTKGRSYAALRTSIGSLLSGSRKRISKGVSGGPSRGRARGGETAWR